MRSLSAGLEPVALITGAARRIGKALTQALHANGHNVIIHCHNSITDANHLAEQLNRERPDSAFVIQANLNRPEAVQALAQKAQHQWQRMDVLINNASTFYPTDIGATTQQHWQDLLGSNLQAPFFLAQALADNLRRQRGCIINISDINARKPVPGHTVYCIAKAGNDMLTRSLALELAPEVRVNGIAPGAILWPQDSRQQDLVKPEKLLKIPLGTLGGTDAIVNTALFLIQQADYMTGEIIAVDGGVQLR